MEETKLNIYQKLHSIQKHVMGLGKDKSANSYRYVTGDKVLENIKPLMNELGLILKQELISIENVRQDYIVGINAQTPQGRPKSEILSKCMMKFTWVDIETGEKDENLFGANGQNDWDKGVGSALTYAERYFLLKYFHIATDEDDIDNPDRKPIDEPKAQTVVLDIEKLNARLMACATKAELQTVYTSFTPAEKTATLKLKDQLKNTLQ